MKTDGLPRQALDKHTTYCKPIQFRKLNKTAFFNLCTYSYILASYLMGKAQAASLYIAP